ncbi:hypothetical protein C1H46_037214 [Malus baccata]|uniref:Terpene synthase N-terminal domain-containing protein n=1 Tax=Malus baccata TaxID=106549 RepID=A0A540KSS5_MALBA|nr:hypothetical protein C1H46_037214 [Malus baccata]
MAFSSQAIFAVSTPPNIAQKMNLHLGHSNLIQLNISKPMSTIPLTPPCLQDDIRFQHEQKLEVFRNLLSRVGEESLNMIDAIQRLGIDYHFEEQIDLIISSHANTLSPQQNDLHEVSLRFRLLRQHGHFVPEDVFNNFKEREGKYFKQILNSEEVKGLMSVYEASQLSMEGEDALDDAGKLSGHLLNYLGPHEARLVENTLGCPHHQSLAAFMAKNFFLPNSQAGMNNRWLYMLQEVAKTDFNLVQSLHHKEIVQISKSKLVREERIQLTKPISFIYLIDDIFDVYGTLDELTLFTEAVNRWEIGAIEHLPDYMKICFEALYNITNEISCEVSQKHGWNPLHSLKKAWGSLCNAFLVEAKWFKSGHLPKAEHYLKNGIVSSGVNVVMVHIFFLLGQGITKQSVELVNETPAIVSSTAAILRLWDDFGSAEDENQSGHDGSYVRCYLQQHPGSSMEEAQENTVNMISKEWKNLNKELVSPNYPFPATFTNASLNLARMVPLMYNYDDNQHLPSLEVYMKSMLYETESVH